MAVRLTDKTVKAAKPPTEGKDLKIGYRLLHDQQVPGFGVRVSKTGIKAFFLTYRANGRERRYTIGRYPAWSVAAARDYAARLRREVDAGGDPANERDTARAEPTLADLCDAHIEYARRHNRPSTIRDYNEVYDRFVRPSLGNRKLSGIKHADIERLHSQVTERGPYLANRLHSVLSRAFNLAIKWGWRADNPAMGIERNPETKRKRYLTGDELRRLSQALADYPYLEQIRLNRTQQLEQGKRSVLRRRREPIAERLQSANIVRLLMLTGARKGEVLAARWEQFDFQAGTWTKPGAETKQKTEHRVPLSAPACRLLTSIEKRGEYVFPGKNGGAITDIKHAWSAIASLAGLTDVRIHDLRHTYAAQLASAGLSLPVIGALLGHTQAATTARYAHLMDDPLREATERVGAIVDGASTGHRADVIEIGGKR